MLKKGKVLSAVLGVSLLFNSTFMPIAMATSVFDAGTIVVEEGYDPFSDEEVQKPKTELTMKEKVAKILEEEKNAKNKSSIEGVAKGHIYIPKGTKFKVELVEDASSKNMKKHQPVEIKMVDNLIINGVIVIPKGTIGLGYVHEVQKAAGFGRKGVLRIAGYEIKTVNNIVVSLKKGLQGQGSTDGGAVAVAAAVSLLGGFFMKGSNINYPAGTNFEVEVKNNVDLQATPENLQDVMNPNIPRGVELQIDVK